MNQKEQNTNILAIKNPELAKEWHPTKNGDLKPTDVTYSSIKKVWWKCKCGCSWLASIYTRATGYGNCPNCKKNKKEKVALKVSPKIQITRDNKIKIN